MLLRLYLDAIQALLGLYSGFDLAILRLYLGAIKALLLRHYGGSIKALAMFF